MERISFRQLPPVARLVVGVAFYLTWWFIEVNVIERYGIWKYMPLYKVGDACVWDLAVALVIGFAIWRASSQHGT